MGLLKKSKIAAGVLTVGICGALLLAGTFAWVSFSKATNDFLGDGTQNGGTLHDDFDEPKKQVYVENWGESVIYTRLKLLEYMEIGEGAGKYKGPSNNRTQDSDNHAVSLISGKTIFDMDDWTPHIPDKNVKEICSTPANFHDYWEWGMGGQKYYKPAPTPDRESSGYVAQNPTDYTEGTSGIKQTLNATVVTMADWHSLGKPKGPYWVIDTDGWAYWADELMPGTATGMLLNSVNSIKKPTDTYYYGIHIWAQMATKDGKPNYTDFKDDGWTDDGRDLMNLITGGGGGGTSQAKVTLSNMPESVKVGETVNAPGFTVEPAGSEQRVTWSTKNSDIVSVDQTTGVVKGLKAGSATITAKAPNGAEASYTIKVLAGDTELNLDEKLDKAIKDAEDKLKGKDQYTEKSVKDLEKALDAAVKVKNKSNANNNEKEKAIKDIYDAIDKLEQKSSNLSILTPKDSDGFKPIANSADLKNDFQGKITGNVDYFGASYDVEWETKSKSGEDCYVWWQLENILEGSDYTGVTVAPAEGYGKYKSYLSIENDRDKKPAIKCAYKPDVNDYVNWISAHGTETNPEIQIMVVLTQNGVSSEPFLITATYDSIIMVLNDPR